MPAVFFSYARADAAAVDRIANDLRSQGVELWIDRDNIVAGEEWLPQIEAAISQAEFMLVFISEASLQNQWVQREYEAAFQNQSKAGGTRLIPVLLEQVQLPSFLSKIQYVDFTRSYFEGITKLLRTLEVIPVGPRPDEVLDTGRLAHRVAEQVAKLLGLETGYKPSTASPKSSTPQTSTAQVFVIMAYSRDMDPIFDGIREAGVALGLSVMRTKDLQGDYKITDQIIKMIESARFVVVDLSHERPNVYFELGYARGLGKTVISIAREGTNVHFDVKDWTYIAYIDSRLLEQDLKKRFEFELSHGVREPSQPT
jgi:hypothetical protein